MDTSEIKSIVKTLRESNLPVAALKSKYGQFAEDYPRLFEFAVDKRINLTYLDMMLQQLELLNNKQTDLDKADEHIYGKLRTDYVDPHVK